MTAAQQAAQRGEGVDLSRAMEGVADLHTSHAKARDAFDTPYTSSFGGLSGFAEALDTEQMQTAAYAALQARKV